MSRLFPFSPYLTLIKIQSLWLYITWWMYLIPLNHILNIAKMVHFMLYLFYHWVQMAYACNPSFLAGWGLEDCGLRPVWANSLWDSHHQNNQSKMDWRCGSRGRAPALQSIKHWVQTQVPQKAPIFYHNKNNNNNLDVLSRKQYESNAICSF
jgi:hypothetical protein